MTSEGTGSRGTGGRQRLVAAWGGVRELADGPFFQGDLQQRKGCDSMAVETKGGARGGFLGGRK